MKTQYISSILAVASIFVYGACDKESMNEFIETAPVVTTFSPAEGYAGCEITVTGEALNNVVSATIGGEAATISQRVSDKCIRITVPAMAHTGKLTLTNAIGSGESASEFTMTYPAPAPRL